MVTLKSIIIAFALCCITGQVFASAFFVLPRKDRTGVYQNEIRRVYDAPVYYVSAGEALVVMQSGRDHYLVKNGSDERGWIEKQECIKAPRSATFTIDSAVINAEYSVNGFGLVLVTPPADDIPLTLGRSFKSEILVNADWEELTRNGAQ